MNNHWLSSEEVDLELYPISKVNEKSLKKDFGIEFEPPRPMENRSEVVDTQLKEVNNRFTTVRRAIEKINPELEDKEIDTLVKEIDDEDIRDLDKELEKNLDTNNLDKDNDGKQEEKE